MVINNKYFVVNRAEVTQTMLNECVGCCIDELKRNNDNTKVIMKGLNDGVVPPSMSSYIVYTHAEILTELTNTEWIPIES